MPDDDSSRPPAPLPVPGFALFQLGRAARAALKDALAGEGLSFRAHCVLVYLAEYGRVSQRELADRIAMDRSDLVDVLDDLEQAGHVRRTTDVNDRRRHLLSVTRSGVRIGNAGARLLDEATACVLSRLTASEQATLHRLVSQALGGLPD